MLFAAEYEGELKNCRIASGTRGICFCGDVGVAVARPLSGAGATSTFSVEISQRRVNFYFHTMKFHCRWALCSFGVALSL